MPPKGKGKAKAYGLANIDAEGMTVTDIFKKQWKVGKPVGTGGFGRLYQVTDISKGTGSAYVIKIEPHDNGPLFSELSFYQRKAKPEHVQSWMSSHKMKSLGMPLYVSSGLHETKDGRYRFMVIPQYKSDLQNLFVKCNKRFPVKTVLNLMLQVIDVLEYLHTNDYVHADIKAANLLLGIKDPNQSYLVDYGLACKFRYDNKHIDYKPDPRKAHDGTIEFTSIDAHMGCGPSQRGDLEILGYCALQWLCSTLPWESCLTQPEKVKTLKQQFMEDPKKSIQKLSGDVPSCVVKYMTYVKDLSYDQAPDYKFIRKCLKADKLSGDGKLDFPAAASTSTPSTSRKRKSVDPGPAITAPKKSRSSTPAAAKRKKATPAAGDKKPRQTKGKSPAAAKKKATPKRSPKTADHPSTSGLLSDNSEDSIKPARNKNNSALASKAKRRQSLDPRAMKALNKAKTTAATKAAASKKKAPIKKPTNAAVQRTAASSLAAQYAISRRTAAAARQARLSANAVGSPMKAAKSPRVKQLKSTTTISTQTSPGLQGLKGRKKAAAK